MPEQLRALIVILVLATGVVAFAHRFAISITEEKNFTRRRNLWFALTFAAFLSANFWIYLIVAIPLIIYANHRESNPPALFFFILFVLPMGFVQIPGMGLINYLIELSNARILELIILLPAFIVLLRKGANSSLSRTGTDKVLIAYILLAAMLHLRNSTLTDSLRHVFYLFIDAFLPYFVISRSLTSLQSFRDALLSFVMAIMVLAPMAIFESLKHWLLYSNVTSVLDLENGMTNYLGRDGILRAIVTAGQPIALGYLMAVGIGMYLFLQRSIQQKLIRRFGMVLLVAGLIAPLSRGPWVGAAVLLVVYIATDRYAIRRLISLALVAMLFIPVASMLPGGKQVINLLPFIGSTEKRNIDYREQLITNSMIVISRSPWFGTEDFLKTPEMEAMRQSEGIIDVVNTYIGIALERGFIGLGLFTGFFVLTLLKIYRAMRSISDRDNEEYLLGRVLLATLLAVLVTIATASSITIIPIVYWSVAGLGVAYAQMVRRNLAG